jgi:hypothetical protein
MVVAEGAMHGPRSTVMCAIMGGVIHYSLHCRLAKFRDIMCKVKYSPVIGCGVPTTWRFILGPYKSAHFPANYRAMFHLIHQITKFCQTTV